MVREINMYLYERVLYNCHISSYHKERSLLKEAGIVDYNMKEFVAYSRKLLRSLLMLKKMLDNAQYDEAKEFLDELIDDTQKDIEA